MAGRCQIARAHTTLSLVLDRHMNGLRFISLVSFVSLATMIALGQAVREKGAADLARQPKALVRSLYAEVVARHPMGIPMGPSMKVFAPYLSTALLQRIQVSVACAADYDRQYPDPNLKPPFAWLEAGLFSGDDEQADPQTFHIERTQLENDGSFRVYVRLTWGRSSKPWVWRVAAVVVRENSHYALDDVIYLKDSNRKINSRMSEYLSAGCDGPRWVGNQQNGQK